MGAFLAAVGGLIVLTAGDAGAAPSLEPCRPPDDYCARVTVPLDRSGAVGGSVRLHVVLQRAESPSAPPVVAIGGTQGQASSAYLHVLDIVSALEYSDFVPDGRVPVDGPPRDVISLDLRGTGRSGPLRCETLESGWLSASVGERAAACAASLGSRRGLYTARESAEDIEAVRQALGVEKIALIGVSYGARVALTYAQRHPDRVERLLLQSPPPPEGDDLLYRSTFAAVPAAVEARCGPRACRVASKRPVADVSALARLLERGDVRGQTIDAAGRRRSETYRAFDLFDALGGGTFGWTSLQAWEMAGMVRNALRGDVAPLLRARRVGRWYRSLLLAAGTWRSFNVAAYAASVCEESVLPWDRTASIGTRDASASALAFGSAGAFGSFGPRTALQSDIVALCRRWPVASSPPDPPKVLPSIPTLILAGRQDPIGGLSHAEAVRRLIPGARVLPIPGFSSDLDLWMGSCAQPAVREFFAGQVPASCGPSEFGRVGASAPPPLSLAEVRTQPGRHGRVGRTLTAVRLTLRDGASMIPFRFFVRVLDPASKGARALYGTPVRVGALRSGTYRLGFRNDRFALRGASYVPGVRVSGAIAPVDSDAPSKVRGRLRVGGAAAARGTLTLRGHVLSGRLGGRPVRMGIGSSAYPDVTFGD
jgi:pimeloyl-ACP methyl ester carboxylesterase